MPSSVNYAQLHTKWNYPAEIHFGLGELNNFKTHMHSLGISHPLIVTDEGFAQLPVFTDWLNELKQQLVQHSVFQEVQANPTKANVEQGIAAYISLACDGVVAIGGGSALDAGKTIALIAKQQLDVFDLEDLGDNWKRVNEAEVAPCIAIPTTAGTGSEVGRAAVILDESSHTKKLIFHPKMLPLLVIADPALTLGLPPKLTAATGVDAFVHSFEAFCAPGFHPMADGIAVEGMRLVWQNLKTVVDTPSDIAGRCCLMAASTMGATAFQKGLGAVHALAHPLGAVYGAHHGLLNAILLPYVIKANQQAIEDKLNYLCTSLAMPGSTATDFINNIVAWLQGLNIPHSLADIGINIQRSDEIAAKAVLDPSANGNPIAFNQEQYKRILLAAIEGKL